MNNKKTVVITGAGRGLGHALSEIYSGNGYEVFAGDIHFRDHASIAGVHKHELDITSRDSILGFLEKVHSKTDQLDLLINNAGISDNFPMAETDPEIVYHMINVNAMGSLRMIHHFLPMLLKARGRIITISSESIAIPGAFQPYQVTKIALEGLHKTLRQELSIKGINMIAIRPGAINTALLRTVRELKPQDYLIFKKEFDNFRTIAPKYIGRVIEPHEAAHRIYRISQKKNPSYVYRINHDPLRCLMALLPERWRDWLVKKSLAGSG